MDSETTNYVKYFLPSYFRIIGLVLVLVSIIILVFAALVKSYLDFLPAAHLILMYNRLSFIFGLSLMVFSREREEKEETQKARFNALIFSLLAGITLLIILEIINILNNNVPVNAVDFMIIQMCLYYIFFRLKN